MTSYLAYVSFVGVLLLTFASPHAASGSDTVDLYTQRTRNLAAQSFDKWQRSSTASRSASSFIGNSGGTKALAAANQAALRKYLSGLVPEMKPSSKVAHIPREYPVRVDVENPEKKWTKYYTKAKNSLRPNVKYDWSSNAGQHRGMVTLTEDHIATLKDNFDILMWYRNELDLKATGDKHQSAKRFKLFLDYFVADLLDGLPSAPKIDLTTGKVDGDQWELDERNLREQLIMAYRYLIAKHQIYEEYDQFGPADHELLVSMMKIAFLVGAHMNPEWFQETDVNLKQVTKNTRWKKPMVDALEVLQEKGTDLPDYEEPCVIAIPPPKPKPKQVQPKTQAVVGDQKIEIIIRSKP